MEILENKKNNLMHREEIVISLKSEITPSKSEAINLISEKLNKSSEKIVIYKIEGKYGVQDVKIYARIYDDKNFKDKFETISKKMRKKLEESKSAEVSAGSAEGA